MIPDSITAKATMNVTNGLRNALFAYSAAPAACGYFVDELRVRARRERREHRGQEERVQIAPPTRPPTSPTRA